VPEDSALFSVSHLPIPDSLRTNITFERYESGHMMYLYKPDAEKLRRDLVKFLTPAAR
jgi:carboxypeptidase C (cathepsin A)